MQTVPDKMETKTYPTVIEGIENPIQVSRGKIIIWCWIKTVMYGAGEAIRITQWERWEER